MRVINTRSPESIGNGFTDQNDPVAQKYLADLQEVYKALVTGKLHCRFIEGDRKGSIAKLIPDPDYALLWPRIEHGSNYYNRNRPYQVKGHYIRTIAKWTGRQNKVKVAFPHLEAELLLDYEGPTVWEKFDAKRAKEEALKNPGQRDIDGNVLNVGDKVLYINARYGARMVLTHGVIKQFKAVADRKGTTITTVVEDENGQLSDMLYPESMIYLKRNPTNE